MKLTLIQPIQNELYDFDNNPRFSVEESISLADENVMQSIHLAEQINTSDLIVTTEALNYPGFLQDDKNDLLYCIREKQDYYVSAFSRIAKEKHSYLVAGLFRAEGETVTNSAYIFDREGNIIDIYDKIHLAGAENIHLTRGTRPVTFDTEFGRIGVLICFDMQFPQAVQSLKEYRSDLIVCPTWGWENGYVLKRAEESGIYLAGAMSVPFSGIMQPERNPSSLIDGKCNVIVEGDRNTPCVVEIDFDLK